MLQFTDAIRSYERATQLDPSNADVTLGWPVLKHPRD
jgi:cytochrome c-type biogenesis protein CcmH/NrfG